MLDSVHGAGGRFKAKYPEMPFSVLLHLLLIVVLYQ